MLSDKKAQLIEFVLKMLFGPEIVPRERPFMQSFMWPTSIWSSAPYTVY